MSSSADRAGAGVDHAGRRGQALGRAGCRSRTFLFSVVLVSCIAVLLAFILASFVIGRYSMSPWEAVCILA